MVGKGDCRSAVFGRAPAEAVDAAGPVEEGVLRVNVEMNELRQLRSPA
jgi:hypothetical protein